MSASRPILLIGCGALAREMSWAINEGGWPHMEIACLPADLHNRPGQIPPAIRQKIRTAKETGKYDKILAVYGDCGTGGELDRVLSEESVERIPGAHCYEFYAGHKNFLALNDEEIGSFYLTDYLVRFFDRLVIKGLGLDRYPHLRDDYFRHYKRVVHLSQGNDPKLREQARKAAEQLGLAYVHKPAGVSELFGFIKEFAGTDSLKDEKDALQ